MVEEAATTLPDPRDFANAEFPGWLIIQDVLHVYDYEGRGLPGPARLASVKMSRVREALPEPFKGFSVEETYSVMSNDGNVHGHHWHPDKMELMVVDQGAWRFRLTSAFGHQTDITVRAGESVIIFVASGTKHDADPIEPDSVLRVLSSTEQVDGVPHAYKHWPEDITIQ